MTHSDNKGLVLPPEVAENKLVIIPLLFKGKEKPVLEKAKEIEKQLKSLNPILDDSEEYSPGYKYAEHELKGVPLRIEIGPRDLENKTVMIKTRIGKEKIPIPIKNLKKEIPKILENMQKELFEIAKKRINSQITEVSTIQEFKEAIKNKKLIKMNWCGETSCEENIKDKTGASTRCTLLKKEKAKGNCPFCNKKAKEVMYFSKSY
jgi:prolyl-tRNA synthetase